MITLNRKSKDLIVIIFLLLVLTLLVIDIFTPMKEIPVMYKFCQGKIQRSNLPWNNTTIFYCDQKPFVCNQTDCKYVFS